MPNKEDESHKRDVFIVQEITNQDIYSTLIRIEKKVDYTNGKVKFNRMLIAGIWMAITALVGALMWLASNVQFR